MIRINLLPVREIQAEWGRRQELTIAGLALALTVVLIVLLFLFQSYRIGGLDKELGGLRKEVAGLDVQVKEIGEIKTKIAELKEKLKVIDDLTQKKTGPVRVMESLSQATPSRLWLTQFRETGGLLSMEGLAVDDQTVADFMRGLSKSPHFVNVDLIETARTEKEGIPLKKFSIRAKLLYKTPSPAPPDKAASAPGAIGPKVEAKPATKEEKPG